MSLFDHARAARILADAFGEGAAELTLQEGKGGSICQITFHTLCALENSYRLAAARMEDEARADIRAIGGGGCTIEHAGIPAGKTCGACGARGTARK